jgi:galactokinase
MRVAVASDVPIGSGLSSSAALEVAAATAFERVIDLPLKPWDKILLCQRAEHEFAGVPCGIMDQATGVLARERSALLLDCQSHGVRHVSLGELDGAVLVMNTMVRHDLADGAYAQRRAECGSAIHSLQQLGVQISSLRELTPALVEQLGSTSVLFHRARHVLNENNRTQAAAAAIGAGDAGLVGAMMYASHASLRDDYQVSCSELDLLVTLMGEHEGVHGARMTGGGFGGCVVALVEPKRAEHIGQTVAEQFRDQTGECPMWFVTRGGKGTHAERL